ncbi:MAG: excinuclease ABC subunit UvrA, partial [Methylococcales bacterium]|nr:excinuclease ABC subunit UvrA [Methylococcales bacterium]
VIDRKGEHVQLLDDLRAQGFIRARIDGEIYDLDEPPALDLKKKHSIEVVVDRFKIRADISLRLSESFETALRISDGIALAAAMDGPPKELLFSEKYACSHCGYSLTELEPRIFSFNNPKGACPSCDGLGQKQHFDPELVIHNPDISLAGGAVRGWDRRNAYYYQIICSLAEHYGFDPELPFSSLSKEIQDIILYGSGRKAIDFKFFTGTGKIRRKRHSFEGIIANMERRYHETDSVMVREELAKYLSNKVCPECQGSRLNTAARNVFITDHALHQITALPIRKALSFFQHGHLSGKRGEVADKITREIRDRLEFLVNVGLDYLTLDRGAGTLSGGEAQRIRLASQIGAGLVGVMYVLDEPSIGLHL